MTKQVKFDLEDRLIDFSVLIIQIMKVSLKELRETRVCLTIIKRGKLTKNISLLNQILNENNELIAIFVKSIKTATGNQRT